MDCSLDSPMGVTVATSCTPSPPSSAAMWVTVRSSPTPETARHPGGHRLGGLHVAQPAPETAVASTHAPVPLFGVGHTLFEVGHPRLEGPGLHLVPALERSDLGLVLLLERSNVRGL